MFELGLVEKEVRVGGVEGVEAGVVAVGEGEEGEAGDGGFVGDAAVNVESEENGDVRAHGDETLGELEGRVYVTLGRVGHEEEALENHELLKQWIQMHSSLFSRGWLLIIILK